MAAALTANNSASDVSVTFEDQQKINRFARLNARMEEIKDELKSKLLDRQNMEDALNEISVAELTDEAPEDGSEPGIKIMEGDVFVSFGYEAATKWIEEKKTSIEKEVTELNEHIDTIKEEMNTLKIALYTKFGKDNINLESED